MNKLHKRLTGALLAFALIVPSAQSVSAEVIGPYSVGFNLNIPTAVGNTTSLLKNGFGFGFDMTYRPETSFLGLRLDVSHGSFDLSQTVLNKIQFADSGWASFWGFDLSAVLTPRNAKTVRPYIQFGPGMYYQHAEASRYTGSGGVVCDPWFGCYDYNSSEDIADISTWRMGWVGGAGINFEFDSGGAMYLQAQYHRIENDKVALELVPIALGFRQSF